jgi:uncharacterized protein
MAQALQQDIAAEGEKAGKQVRRREGFDPLAVQFSPRWLAAGVLGGALALLGVRRGGWPTAVAGGALGLAGGLYAALVEPRRPGLERITLRLPTLPPALDGLRVGQISDLHLGMRFAEGNVRWAVEQMGRERPDLLVLTGDFVSYHHAIPQLRGLLGGIDAPLGVYAVPGNHDHWEGIDEISAELGALGIELLLNERRRLRWRGGELWLIGIDDVWRGSADLSTPLDGLPEGAFTLLLSHVPDVVDEAARRCIPVQLSGHTHGGHLRLPLLGSFCLPLYGTRYPVGFEQVGPTTLYVSRGIGGMPLRLGCRPETTIFTLRCG